jgi:hypothetical protein
MREGSFVSVSNLYKRIALGHQYILMARLVYLAADLWAEADPLAQGQSVVEDLWVAVDQSVYWVADS